MKRRYPFQPLAELRRTESARRARDLVVKEEAARDAKAELDRAEREVRRAEHSRETIFESERARLRAGLTRAQDLMALGRYAERARHEAVRLDETERRARTELGSAEERARASRRELSKAVASESALDRHRQRWTVAERQDRERSEEDETLDPWAARQGTRIR